MILLLPVEKHAHTDSMSVVPKANYAKLKSVVSLLFLPCHNSRTPWSHGDMCSG